MGGHDDTNHWNRRKNRLLDADEKKNAHSVDDQIPSCGGEFIKNCAKADELNYRIVEGHHNL